MRSCFRHAYAMHSSCVRRTGTGPDGKSLFEIIEVFLVLIKYKNIKKGKIKYNLPTKISTFFILYFIISSTYFLRNDELHLQGRL